jgi:hypothetical protein
VRREVQVEGRQMRRRRERWRRERSGALLLVLGL